MKHNDEVFVQRGLNTVELIGAFNYPGRYSYKENQILVSPENVNDDSADQMARDIAKKIEDDLTYPGQIKVTLIRESRSIEYAR